MRHAEASSLRAAEYTQARGTHAVLSARARLAGQRGSLHVARKREGDQVGRWSCHDCKNSFNVLSGTVMQKTKIPLQKWFLAIALIMNAKKSLNSHQLARDLEMHQNSAWYLMQCIRTAMAADQGSFLRGISENLEIIADSVTALTTASETRDTALATTVAASEADFLSRLAVLQDNIDSLAAATTNLADSLLDLYSLVEAI